MDTCRQRNAYRQRLFISNRCRIVSMKPQDISIMTPLTKMPSSSALSWSSLGPLPIHVCLTMREWARFEFNKEHVWKNANVGLQRLARKWVLYCWLIWLTSAVLLQRNKFRHPSTIAISWPPQPTKLWEVLVLELSFSGKECERSMRKPRKVECIRNTKYPNAHIFFASRNPLGPRRKDQLRCLPISTRWTAQ